MEPLEDRRLLSVGSPVFDFGDAPDNYGTTLASDGARHKATGPMLGATRDAEADGDAGGGSPDDDGVTYGPIRAGQLDASVTVNVQNAPSGAKLDAWIDFNRDGSWGGPFEQIASSVDVVTGDNSIEFDVPSWATDGKTYARFRLSTTGDLAPTGAAADGEVEDYRVSIVPPRAGIGARSFTDRTITTSVNGAWSVFAADVDGDGDLDVLSASQSDDKIAWYEQLGTSPVNLGAIDFQELSDLDLGDSERVYYFTTTNDGYLTVDARFDPAAGDVTLRLLDDQGQTIDEVTGGDGYLRIDHTDPAGGTVYELRVSGTNPSVDLRICNLVSPSGANIEVFGTDGSDTFDFAISETYDVSVNGVEYTFDRSQTRLIWFMDHGGADTLTITGTEGYESVKLNPGGVDYRVHGTTFSVQAVGVENITVNSGGGDDLAELVDSDGDDMLTATPGQMVLGGTPVGGSLYTVTANGFRYAHAYARAGGNDGAELLGSASVERAKAYPEFVKLMGPGFYNRVKFFETTTVDTLGGRDSGVMVASDGVDVLWAMKDEFRVAHDVELAAGESPAFERMAYDVTVFGCEKVVARAKGGDDWVELHDSALDDVLIAKPHKIEIMNGPRKADGVGRGDEYKITARWFRNMNGIADRGGTNDVAKLYDSGELGIDIWAAAYVDGKTWSTMTSASRLLYQVSDFERIGGYGFNGGLGENHGTNRKDHSNDVDFVFEHGYWE